MCDIANAKLFLWPFQFYIHCTLPGKVQPEPLSSLVFAGYFHHLEKILCTRVDFQMQILEFTPGISTGLSLLLLKSTEAANSMSIIYTCTINREKEREREFQIPNTYIRVDSR